jgi:spermidine synthase
MADFYQTYLHPHPTVVLTADSVSLVFVAGELQSQMSLKDPMQLEVPYTQTMMGFLLMVARPARILMIGLGGGSLVKYCYQHLPQAHITVVEINPQVIALRKRFAIPDDDARLRTVCADGAVFVQGVGPEFDVVLIDGFDEQGQPADLCTSVFYEAARRVLRPHGVVVVNLDGDHPGHAAIVQRLDHAFAGSTVEVNVEARANKVVFAFRDAAALAPIVSVQRALAHHTDELQGQLRTELQRVLGVLNNVDFEGPVLTEK